MIKPLKQMNITNSIEQFTATCILEEKIFSHSTPPMTKELDNTVMT